MFYSIQRKFAVKTFMRNEIDQELGKPLNRIRVF